MSANQVALWYLVASISFILALKGLSHPSTARRGNVFGGFLVTQRMLEMFKKKEPKAGDAGKH